VFYRVAAALVFLLLAGCATTGSGTSDPAETSTDLSEAVEPRTAETIDEHLYIPKLLPLPGSDASGHVHDNAWERLTHRFVLPECSDREANLEWAEWYAARPDYMGRIFKRAQPWIHYISEELERRDMPAELALLPIVESAYDPFAYSSGRALGPWQFISATGRRYGLKQNWWYDGRRDVWASTDAALRYLNDLAVMFDGDWLLALAGYNSGENRVLRQMKKNEAAGNLEPQAAGGNPWLRSQAARADLPVQVSGAVRLCAAGHPRSARDHRRGSRSAGRPGARIPGGRCAH